MSWLSCAISRIRYTPSRGPLGSLAAPPYDVIGEELRSRLAARNQRNIVHLILPQGEAERYRLAAEKLEAWVRTASSPGARLVALPLSPDLNSPDGRIYVRTGFLDCLRLEPSGGMVRHHEQTLATPLEDRLRLIRATRTQLSPVFVLYSDPSGNALRGLEACSTKERPATRNVANVAYGRRASELTPGAVQEFNDEDGIRHWLQPISDELAIAETRRTLASLPVVIADGHHRYSAALEYRDRMRKAFPHDDPDLSENFILACFVRAEDPGLIVLPTHRVVPAGKLKSLNRYPPGGAVRSFRIQSLDVPTQAHRSGDVVSVKSSEQGKRVVIGLRLAGDPRLHVLVLKEGDGPFAKYPLEAPLRELDVTVLHALILEPEFGIDEDALRKGGRLNYERDAARAAALVESGEAHASFFLRPISTQAVFNITSPFSSPSHIFCPQIASGLVLHRMAPSGPT